MALFTNARDRDRLPILTKLYQAEADPTKDVDELGRLVVQETADIFPSFASQWSSWQVFSRAARKYTVRLQQVGDLSVDAIAMATAQRVFAVRRALTQEEMDTIKQETDKRFRQSMPEDTLGRLEDWREKVAPEVSPHSIAHAEQLQSDLYDLHFGIRAAMDSLADSREPDVEAVGSLNDLMGRLQLRNSIGWDSKREMIVFAPAEESRRLWSPPSVFIYNAVVALHSAIGSGAKFARCAVCESAFQVLRGGQDLCSWRCANRAAVRRNRAGEAKML